MTWVMTNNPLTMTKTSTDGELNVITCSGDVPGNGLARGAVPSRTPSNATGLMSALCSTGRFCDIADQTNQLSSRSIASRSPCARSSVHRLS
jgi:hypothetical protein